MGTHHYKRQTGECVDNDQFDFAVMMTRLQGRQLDSWIDIVTNDSLTATASFARKLRRDIDAVRNGLALPYSSVTVGRKPKCPAWWV